MSTQGNEVIGQVRHALSLDPKVDAPKITISFLGDVVALTGVVDTEEEVLRAEQVARTAVPGVTIDNGLTVSFTQDHGAGHVWQNSELQRAASEALAQALDTIAPAGGATVGVEVIHGIAHLRGSCATVKERLTFVNAVAGVAGVKRVITDDLDIAPVDADDFLLGDMAVSRLRALAPDVAPYVAIDVRNRGAHLIGRVRATRDRQLAEDAVMQVPGIKAVYNELVLDQDEHSGDADVRIEQALRHAIGAAGLPKPNINVFYTRGVLTIDGEVELPEQRQEALRVMRATMKKLVSDRFELIDTLKVNARRGQPPHPESELLQHGKPVKNSPVVPLEMRGPAPQNKASHTAPIEDRRPEFEQTMPKRKDRD